MTFQKGDRVWVIFHSEWIEGVISNKVYRHHGSVFNTLITKWHVKIPQSDFRIPYLESDLIAWKRQKIINDLNID